MDFNALFESTGFAGLQPRMLLMWAIAFGLFYLAIAKKFEPLLLVPIAFGALLVNLPNTSLMEGPYRIVDASGVMVIEGSEAEMREAIVEIQDLISAAEIGEGNVVAINFHGKKVSFALDRRENERDRAYKVRIANNLRVIHQGNGGLLYYFNKGISLELFPPLIFLGVGALTDFGPLIANPRTLLLGAAAQFGVFGTFFGAVLLGFSTLEAAAIGIIGGADGPTSIFIANALAPDLLGAIAVAAYSYMALVPVIQPPIMRLLTTESERRIRMKSLRTVSRLEKVVFALAVLLFCLLLIPSAAPLIAMLMLGNFLRECGVTDRLVKASQNEIINIVTIFLGVAVGTKMTANKFLDPDTLKILVLGVVAFVIATASGILMAKLMNVFIKENKINPLIGSAGVSAVPMAARVSQVEGQKADPQNFLLMHAMGPNVAGVIGSAMAAGFFIAMLGG